jgi:hypothetical protein
MDLGYSSQDPLVSSSAAFMRPSANVSARVPYPSGSPGMVTGGDEVRLAVRDADGFHDELQCHLTCP